MKNTVSNVMLCLCFVAGTSQAAIIKSDFDNGLDGWQSINNGPAPGGVTYQSSGGNPGGFFQARDNIGGTLSALAPDKFLGDLSLFNGGLLSFDGILISTGGNNQFGTFDGTVTISSGTDSAALDLTAAPFTTSWQTYSASLSASLWGKTEVEWADLLANVSQITLAIDTTSGNDITGLDNFFVATTVPEPASLLMVAGALGLLLGFRKRSSRRANDSLSTEHS